MSGSMDSRDSTPEPPALLNPWAVLFARECTRRFLATGECCFPRGAGWVGNGSRESLAQINYK